MSAQKLDASLVNTWNLDLHANKYTTSHKNKEVSPPNDVSGPGMGPVRLENICSALEWNMIVWNMVFYDMS